MKLDSSLLTKAYRDDLSEFFDHDSEFLHLLEPLLISLGWPGHFKQLVEALPHYAKALDLTLFRNVMATLNYKSEKVHLSVEDLVDPLLPGLLVPKDKAAMIIMEIHGNDAFVFDSQTRSYQLIPTQGLKGDFYYFKVIDEQTETRGTKGWFGKSLLRFKTHVMQIFFISLLINIFTLATPLFIMMTFDWVFTGQSVLLLFQLSLGMMIIVGASYALNVLRANILAYISARLDITMGDAILERILFLAPSYTENAPLGAQVARIKDFDSIREFISTPFLSAVFELPFSILFLGLIWYLAGPVVLIPVLMVILYMTIYAMLNPKIDNSMLKSAKANSDKQEFQIETLSHMRTIRFFGTQKQWQSRYEKKAADAIFSDFIASMLTSTLNTLSETIMMIAGLLVIGFGVVGVIDGSMSIGALIATMMLVWRVLSPLKTFFSMLPRIDQVFNSIKQVNLLMKLPIEHNPHSIASPVDFQTGAVEFSRVSFRYRQDMLPTLLGINFSIKQGELVAICGQNGAGKSTLLKLIVNLYPIQAGNIFIDHINTRQIDVIALRKSIAYMPQETNLFFGTIAQNFKFSEPLATEQDMIDAAKKAGVLEEIMALPKQFQTRIEEFSNENLSRSFIKKISLARTFLKNSPVILLDEPTNDLDNEATERFMASLEELKGKHTIIVVTHRPALMKTADRILYIEQGQLLLNGPTKDVLPKIPMGLL